MSVTPTPSATPSSPATVWPKHVPWIVVMLMAGLALVMIVTITSLQQPSPGLCPLFDDYELTNSERHRILLALGSGSFDQYKLEGGQIKVPHNQKAKFLAAIADKGALPAIFQTLDDVQPNPFLARNQQQLLERNRKRKQTRDMILRLPYVQEAWLEIDEATPDSPFHPNCQSAVVMVRPNGQNALTKQQVNAIQGIVSGAFANIQPRQVVVADANIGLSYSDLTDGEQARSIEQVHWSMNRRQYYLEHLHQLLSDFPELEIFVEINRRCQATPEHSRQNKMPPQPPARLASNAFMDKGASSTHHGNHSLIPTLNCSSLDDEQIVSTTEDEKENSTASKGGPADSTPFETDCSNSLSPATALVIDNTESIRIRVLIPASLVHGYSNETPDQSLSHQQKLEQLKTAILTRIRHGIPQEVLATTSPIILSVAEPGDVSAAQPTLTATSRLAQVYGPLAAATLFGLLIIFWVRPFKPKTRRKNLSDLPADDDQLRLQAQLNELFDSDPVTAAKVIKNWLRDAA